MNFLHGLLCLYMSIYTGFANKIYSTDISLYSNDSITRVAKYNDYFVISVKFQDFFSTGYVVNKINITLSIESFSRDDMVDIQMDNASSFGNQVQLEKIIQISVRTSTMDIDLTDSCIVQGLTEDDNFFLQISFGMKNVHQNISQSISAFLQTSGKEPVCDFDTMCFFETENKLQFSENDTVNKCHQCDHLPHEAEIFSGRYGYSVIETVWIQSQLIYGSTSGCHLSMTLWRTTIKTVIVTVTSISQSSIIEIVDLSKEKATRQWKNETVFIGKILEPFNIRIDVDSLSVFAVDNINLIYCDKDLPVETCNEPLKYRCLSGACIDSQRKCDMIYDCFHGDDEKECEAVSPLHMCNFEQDNLCGWKTVNITPSCGWSLNNTDDLARQNLKTDLLHHSYKSRGKILYFNGTACAEKKAELYTIGRFSRTSAPCNMTYSFMKSDSISLQIDICTSTDICSTIMKYIHSNPWRTENVQISSLYDTYYINISAVVDDVIFDIAIVGLDAISFDDECFIPGTSEADKQWSTIIVAGILFTLICMLVFLFTMTKDKIKTFGRPRTKRVCRVKSKPLKRSLLVSNTIRSPLYAFPLGDEETESLIQCIPRESISVGRIIGKGAFGEVYSGFLKDTNTDSSMKVAIKTLPPLCSDQTKSDFIMEAITLSKLKHPNIVTCLGISIERSTILLVTEMMEGGDLRTFLLQMRSKLQGPSLLLDLLQLCLDVANGCQYLEKNGCIHRDIAARNCLLSEHGPKRVVKVGDFGMSRLMGRTNYYKKRGAALVPVKWMSPEAFMDGLFTTKTDVWSFGILLWEIFSLGCVPYPGKSNEEVMELVKKGGRLSKPDLCLDEIYCLMQECWEPISKDRPCFSDIRDKLDDMYQSNRRENIL